MNYLSVENLSKAYGIKKLFKNISFGVDYNQKVALVAKNGTGKSTLLKAIMDIDPADSGEVTFRKGIKVGFLRQDEQFDESKTVLETVLTSDNEELKAVRAYQESVAKGDDTLIQEAFDKMNELNAWDAEVRVNQILSNLKLNDTSLLVKKLSGGQRKRLALAIILISEPDFMLLDEPTNHLDLDMIEWLESYLTKQKSTILMVTHDRYFLEVVCDEILELAEGNLYRYKGNFSYYLDKKAEREENLRVTISKAKSLMRSELEWMRRMPKARGTKQKARQDAFYATKKVAKQKIKTDNLDLKVKMERLGSKIVELHKVKKEFDDLKILNGFDYVFRKGEKIGILGKNGTGKSTFLNMLTGSEELTGGKIVVGETVKFGYYNQKGINLKEDKRVIEVIKDIAEYIPAESGRKLSAAQFLERFLFDRDMQWNYVSTLSGGEKRRLYLLTILIENPNFLILDEPTNDLDIFTLSVLEQYLIDFEGCVIVVSHDRYFMDKIVDHMFVFNGKGEIDDIFGNYSAYRTHEKEQLALERKAEKAAKVKVEKPKKEQPKEKTKLSYKEKLEFEGLEKEIEELESKRDAMNERVASNNIPANEVEEFYKELSQISTLIEDKTMRWMELAEFG